LLDASRERYKGSTERDDTMRHAWIGCLLTGLAVLLAPRASLSADDVLVSASQEIFAAGDLVTLHVENNSGKPIYVPGCHPFEVEEFRNDAYTRVKRDPCTWEGIAATLPPGKHEFNYQTSTDDKGIYRLSVTYGWGCNEGLPLSHSRCDDFTTAYSGSYRVGGGG
jgi:hypothetical protein